MGSFLLLAAVTSSATLIVPPQPAQAASCLAESCNHKWPNDQGCVTSDVQQIDSQRFAHDVDEDSPDPTPETPNEVVSDMVLFYSPECRATWAEFTIVVWQSDETVWDPYPQFWGQPQYGGQAWKAQAPNPENEFQDIEWVRLGTTNTWRSPMWSWTESVQACMFWEDAAFLPDINPFEPDETYEYRWPYEHNCLNWL